MHSRWWCCVVLACAAGCSSRPTCPADDLACIGASFSINDFQTFDDDSKRDKLADLTIDLPAGTSTKLSLTEQGALDFADASYGMLVLFTWHDANGCRPSLCMNHCPRGVRCAGGGRCTPARKDGLQAATTQHWIQYGSDPSADADFDLVVTPASATGCPTDVAALIDAGDATVAFGPPVVVPVHLPGPGGGGGGGGGDCAGLVASTLSCTPLGSGGVASTCVTDAEYVSIFGTPAPASCAAQGATGCLDTQKGALVHPCCAGLTCRVGSACGGGSTVGGVCLP